MGKIIAAAVLIVVGVLFVVGCSSALVVYNKCIQQENRIITKYNDNQNVYDSYFKTLKEIVQVNDMYADDLKKITVAAIQGRYGDGGSKAVFQWIKEHNPTIDSSLYSKIHHTIEGGRHDFRQSQTEILDMVRIYKNDLDTMPGGFVASVLGFPKNMTRVELDSKYGKAVTSDSTEQMFKTGKSDPIKLR